MAVWAVNQQDRLLDYLRDNPGCSSLDIIRDLSILNTTGRISDLRAAGFTIDTWRSKAGVWRYRLIEAPVQMAAGL